jgi:hypothetical protein
LADSLESVPNISSAAEDEETNNTTNSEVERLKELLVVGLGHKGSRVIMMMRFDDQIMIYQVSGPRIR